MSGASDKAERFVRHLEPLQGVLEAYCRRGLINPSDVEDALQSAVMQAYRDFHLYVEGTNFRAWMFRYVSLEVLNCNRRQRRRESPLEGEPATAPLMMEPGYASLLEAPEFVLEYCEQELAAAIRGLPEREQAVLLLSAIGEFKYREIAEILEIPVGSVMGCLSRARTEVRRKLAASAHHRSP